MEKGYEKNLPYRPGYYRQVFFPILSASDSSSLSDSDLGLGEGPGSVAMMLMLPLCHHT